MARLASTALVLACLTGALFSQPIEIGPLGDRPFRHGPEKLSFNVTYLSILGGYAQMEVRHPSGPKPVDEYILRAWTTPFVSALYRLDMTLTARNDPSTLKTLFYEENRFERSYRIFHQMIFQPDGRTYHYGFLREGRTNYDAVAISEPGFNVVSSFYIARCLDLSKPGTVYHTKVYYHREYHHVEVHVKEPATLRTKWGKKNCLVIIPRMKFRGIFMNEGDIVIYLSDDEYRIPLLMESKLTFGSFKATLMDGYPESR